MAGSSLPASFPPGTFVKLRRPLPPPFPTSDSTGSGQRCVCGSTHPPKTPPQEVAAVFDEPSPQWIDATEIVTFFL